jgi:hypothetical protein
MGSEADRPSYVAVLLYKQGSLDERTVESTTYTAADDEDGKTKAWAWANSLITSETTSLQVTRAKDGYGLMSVPMEPRT